MSFDTKSRFSVDPKSKFGLPPSEEIEAEIAARAVRRLLDRQERGWPITINAIASVGRCVSFHRISVTTGQ